MNKPVTQTIMRSGLGAVRGLGSAKSSTTTEHWFAERVAAMALIPLTLWFIYSILSMVGAPRSTVAAWAAHPLNATFMLALVWLTFQHLMMGLGSVMTDYIHGEKKRMVAILAMRGVLGLFCVAGLLAVLKLAVVG